MGIRNSKDQGTSPSPSRRRPPSNTAMHRPTPRTSPNRRLDGSRTFAQLRRKVPISYNLATHIRPKNYPFPWTNIQTYLITGPVRPTVPNSIWIRSTVFPQSTGQTHRPTDRPTDAKFHQNRSSGCGEIAIFPFFKMAAVRHLGFAERVFEPSTKSIKSI